MIANEITKTVLRTRREEVKFSIIIPTWNNLEYLKLCIESIRKNSFYKHQLIVHVNEGSDGTIEWIKEQEDIDFSFSKINVGVCYALNTCRKLVQTSYFVYMNDDMFVCPNWDKELFDEILKIGTENFFLSSTMIEPEAQTNCAIEQNYGTDIKSFDRKSLLEEYSDLPFSDWQGSTWPPNIVHINTWDLVGGYSTEFSPGMYSDPDFSMKLWQAGIRDFKGVGKSRVYHFGSKSVGRIRKNKGYYTFINKWGITSGTFTRFYLKRGELYNGKLNEPHIPFVVNVKNKIKRLLAIFIG